MELFHNEDTDPGIDEPERSDQEIHADILKLFSENDYLKNKNLQVSVKKCVVTLTGTVFTQQSWELAQDLAADVRGVQEIRNRIEVKPGPGNSTS